MKSKQKILLLEDDTNLGFILSEHLEMNGFTVDLRTNGVDGFSAFSKNTYALCLVDVMMPKMDGFTFVADVRKQDNNIPVIFLTARSLKEDRIEGLKIGADDYVTKPFSMEELMLRITAVLRRSVPEGQEMRTEKEHYTIGAYRYDRKKSMLSFGTKRKIILTSKESELLSVLVRNENEVTDRNRILTTVWGDDSYYTSRSMDVFISKLRKYFKDDPSVSIVTIHGKGYKLLIDR